ncbi:Hypothetical predicted protein [Paramuricea clavata]|uniref:Uncharacterized protein n=1 Tax=Paramuricea clavata TaxID=317549 RepID=A0A7D9D958_PARCT|nr:Hypothetical predicted protein [Paramuricea clavata]
MKIQRKRVEGSQQRIEDGVVYFTVFSLMQIVNVRTFVQRLADWVDDIACNRPKDGWSELYTKMQTQKGATYDYMADLDSVYKNQEGSYVYGLVKNKGNNIKNAYVFFVVVELVDQTVQSFCWPFLLKTKPVTIRSRAPGL